MNPIRHVLVADDDPNDRRLIQRAFQRAGLDTLGHFVADGQAALDFLSRVDTPSVADAIRPAVVVLDLKMPRVGGLQVLERMRESPTLRHVPVVVLTSSSEPSDVAAAYHLGANAFVVKPTDFDAFLAVVDRIVAFWARTNEPPAA